MPRLDPSASRLDPSAPLLSMNFEKTGNHYKLLGYECHEYSGTANKLRGYVSTKACFSTGAPGAAELPAS